MKSDIHPETMESVINCVCGATYTTYSTKPQIRVEFVQSATRFTQDSRQLLIQRGVWKASAVGMVLPMTIIVNARNK